MLRQDATSRTHLFSRHSAREGWVQRVLSGAPTAHAPSRHQGGHAQNIFAFLESWS